MKRILVFVLVLPAALIALLICAGLIWLTLATAPPLVSVISLAVMAAAGAWFFLRRRNGGPVSEGSLMGRQSSKEGLL